MERQTLGQTRDWMDLITEMLWVFERETKLTLRGVCDDFKTTGMSFDTEFRNHFLQIVQKRVTKTYDQFVMKMQFDELDSRNESSAQVSDVSFVAWQHSTGYYRDAANTKPSLSNLAHSRRSLPDFETGNQASPIRRALMDASAPTVKANEEVDRGAFIEENMNEDEINEDDIIELMESDEEVEVVGNARQTATEVHSTSQSAPVNQPSTSRNVSARTSKAPKQNGTDSEKPRYKCKLCKHTTVRKHDLAKHLLSHQKKPFQCRFCPKRFVARDLLEMHLKGHKHKCSKCRKKLEDPDELAEHEENCIQTMLNCNVCGYETSRPFVMKVHMRKHTGELPFSCEYCDKKFSVKYNVTRHIKTVHKNQL